MTVLVVAMVLLALYGMLPARSTAFAAGKETARAGGKVAGEEDRYESNTQTDAAKRTDSKMRIRLFAERFALTPRGGGGAACPCG